MDILTFLPSDYAPFVGDNMIKDGVLDSGGGKGFLMFGPYRSLAKGSYTVIMRGEGSGLSEASYVDVVGQKGQEVYAREYLRFLAGPDIITMLRFDLPEQCDDLEVRLFIGDEGANATLRQVDIYTGRHAFDFSILNKSYIKDLEWTLALYTSYEIYGDFDIPFVLVIPHSEYSFFRRGFDTLLESGVIARVPVLLFEEWVLRSIDGQVPDYFNGWYVQQLVKLYFSRSGFSSSYLTCDSAQIFSRKFDVKSDFYKSGILRTTARQQNRSEINAHFYATGEMCWLKGEVVNAAVVFDAIDRAMGGLDRIKYHYIGCNGLFDSNVCDRLDKWALHNGYNGMLGLIEFAPYEFAWYGSYVANIETERFVPIDPYFFHPVVTREELSHFKQGKVVASPDDLGYLFQPPAIDGCDPQRLLLGQLGRYIKLHLDRNLQIDSLPG